MAKRIVTQVLDDIDGSEGAQEVAFSLDGSRYEIDLWETNRRKLEEVLRPYVDAARKTRLQRQRGGRKGQPVPHGLNAARDWAKTSGIAVSERGRVAKSVLEQYDAVH